MTSHAEIIDSVLARLRLAIPGSIVFHVVERTDDRLTLQVGERSESVIALAIKDPYRPMFHVSYPLLTVKKDGSKHVGDCDSDCVIDGVEWIARQLAQHGVVMPEFTS